MENFCVFDLFNSLFCVVVFVFVGEEIKKKKPIFTFLTYCVGPIPETKLEEKTKQGEGTVSDRSLTILCKEKEINQ